MTHLNRSTPLVLAGLVVTLLGFGLTAIPYAAAAVPGGQINFFDVFSSACSTTVWNGGTFTDGNQGFGGNLGSAQQVPIVANGEQICIEIVLTDQAPSTSYTISTPGGIVLTLLSGSNPFTTDVNGNADVFLIFSISGLSGDCVTHPINISPDIAGGAGSPGQIHHLYGGATACGGVPPFPPPPTVPQFPLGTVGMGLVMAAGFAGMLLIKRKQLKA